MTFVRPAILLVCWLVFMANGCGSQSGKPQSAAQANTSQIANTTPSNPADTRNSANPTATSPAIGVGGLDTCALIEKSEIAAVQGAQVQSVTPNSQMNDAIITSQCYYTVVSADGSKNLSVHLQVMKADPKNPKAVTEYWAKAFHEKSKQGDSEQEKEAGTPRSIPGVGEEAFWIANAKMGVLYALQKGNLLRVSVGGPDNMKIRLEKSKTLMAKALDRIS